MRSASEAGYEGPANLRDAVRCAASAELRDQGALVVLAGDIHPADDVLKTHASAMTTFQSPNLGPLGHVERDRVVVGRWRAARRHVQTAVAAEPVYLVTAVVASDGELLRRGDDARGAKGSSSRPRARGTRIPTSSLRPRMRWRKAFPWFS